jgi:DNA-binding CsgD family transcriptional regulator
VSKLSEKESIDKQDQIIEVLEEILRWTRLQGAQTARTVLLEALKSDKEKVAYQLSNGLPSTDIGKACGVSDQTIRNYWKRWYALGIVQQSRKYERRFERAFSLDDFDIEVPTTPSIPASVKEKTKQAETKEVSRDE